MGSNVLGGELQRWVRMGFMQGEDEDGWYEKEKIGMGWLDGGNEDDGGVEGVELGEKWSRCNTPSSGPK